MATASSLIEIAVVADRLATDWRAFNSLPDWLLYCQRAEPDARWPCASPEPAADGGQHFRALATFDNVARILQLTIETFRRFR